MAEPEFELKPESDEVTGRCECCGNISRAVTGLAYRGRDAYAAYHVHWTVGHIPEYGANFDFIIGEWGEGTSAADRSAVSLVYKISQNGPGFMVIDAGERHVAKSSLVGRALKREEVVGQPIARDVFALCDAIWLQDARVAELSGGPSESA